MDILEQKKGILDKYNKRLDELNERWKETIFAREQYSIAVEANDLRKKISRIEKQINNQ